MVGGGRVSGGVRQCVLVFQLWGRVLVVTTTTSDWAVLVSMVGGGRVSGGVRQCVLVFQLWGRIPAVTGPF